MTCNEKTHLIYKVFYTDRFIPERFGGIIYGPIILIRPKHQEDKGLLEHEKIHVRQWYRGFGILYWLRYKFSRKWRLKYEVQAYRYQLSCYLDSEYMKSARQAIFANFIATKYNLHVTKEQAYEMLL